MAALVKLVGMVLMMVVPGAMLVVTAYLLARAIHHVYAAELEHRGAVRVSRVLVLSARQTIVEARALARRPLR